jgi:hypothetical protein
VGGRILASLLAGWALVVPAFNDGRVIVSFFKTQQRCESYKQEQLRLMAGVVQKSIQDCAEDSAACDTDRGVSEGALGVINAYQASECMVRKDFERRYSILRQSIGENPEQWVAVPAD